MPYYVKHNAAPFDSNEDYDMPVFTHTPEINLQKLKVRDNTMDKVEARLKNQELMDGYIDMIPEDAPFMSKFKVNNQKKVPKLPKLVKNDQEKKNENVADIMYQMLCDSKDLNPKTKYGPEMLDTMHDKEKSDFMAQTR